MGAGRSNLYFDRRTGHYRSERSRRRKKRKKNGCYVATAVYGSYDCPQVWTLRRYRDFRLAKSLHGRAFIRLYYTLSPFLVKCFGNTMWFRNYFKKILDKKVNTLNIEGLSDTPYVDDKW